MNQIINNSLIGLNKISGMFCDYAASVFIQSALLVILLFFIDLLLCKRIRAIFRYCLWLLVLVKLILPPTLSLPTGIGYWTSDRLPMVSNRVFDVDGFEYTMQPNRVSLAGHSDDLINSNPLIKPANSALTPVTWQAVLFVLWLLGVLAFLAVLIQRIIFVRGLVAASCPAGDELIGLLEQCRRQMAVRRDVKLQLSEAIPSPAVCGLFRPVILMPTSLVEKFSPECLRATLIHELAHIKRGDLWINSVQTLLQVVYFYNPFVWFANSVIRKVCEEAVDETVLVALGGQAKHYSNTLIDIGETVFWKADLGLRLIGVAESKKALQWRIRHMLNRPIPKSSKLGALGIAMLLVIAAVLLPMAKAEKSGVDIQSVAGENEEKPTKSLHQAAADGDIEQVGLHIAQGADVNSKDVAGNTPLHRAASLKENVDVMELLLAKGANVNAKNAQGDTPLHVLLRLWFPKQATLELMLDRSAEINATNKEDLMPLDLAVEHCMDHIIEVLIAKGGVGTTIHSAAWVGDVEKVRKLIEQGVDVNVKNERAETLLHVAARTGNRDLAEFLIKVGADLRTRDSIQEQTPLHIAAISGHEDIVKVLVTSDADVNARDKYGQTPLMAAAHQGHEDIVKVLVAAGADRSATMNNGRSPVDFAVMMGHFNTVKLLINTEADVLMQDNQGRTSLHLAAMTGDEELTKLILGKGADVNVVDKDGWTSLHWAARYGRPEVAELLLVNGADPNVKNKSGETPLDVAVLETSNVVVGLLIEKGAKVSSPNVAAYIGDLNKIKDLLKQDGDVNTRNSKGETPLHAASRGGHKDIVEFLIAQGADVNAKKGLTTPFHIAIWADHLDVAELLLAKGADINAAIPRSGIILHREADRGHNDLVEFLIDKGVDIHARDQYGRTALHWSAMQGHIDVVKLLIDKGAEVNVRDGLGFAPLWYAKDKGHIKVVELLRKHGAKE